MATRTANAQWAGNLTEGGGKIALASGAFDGPYSFKSRTEDAPGTNPEELIAAAHAGCFTMAFSLFLVNAGHTPDQLDTEAKVHLRQDPGGGLTISKIDLVTRGRVPGISDDDFQKAAQEAKENCPVSRLIQGGAEITLDATLES